MKKGQFFTLDAVIGLTILFVGVDIAYSAFIQEQVSQPTIHYAEDVMAILAKTRFRDMNTSLTTPEIRYLIEGGSIDRDKTVLAQIGEFYYRRSLSDDITRKESLKKNSEYIITATTRGAIPRVYGWEVKINDESIYLPQQGPLKANAKISIVTQQLSFGLLGQVPYGPYLVEVSVWG